ncbi:MAG TPA: VOC family protein [Streptosporangiaceae bacterium]|jgi:catechol 2,3-dioxygenase-like lactoylglutathione lyase family enzyme
MTQVRSLDHVGVVVDDLEAATEFFLDLGLERDEAAPVQGEWVENIIALTGVRAEVVMVYTPDGGTLELTKFHTPADDQGPQAAAANRLGIRHVAFRVEDVHAIVGKLQGKGVNTVGKVQDYEGTYRLCYLRGPEGIIVELVEQIGQTGAQS